MTEPPEPIPLRVPLTHKLDVLGEQTEAKLKTAQACYNCNPRQNCPNIAKLNPGQWVFVTDGADDWISMHCERIFNTIVIENRWATQSHIHSTRFRHSRR